MMMMMMMLMCMSAAYRCFCILSPLKAQTIIQTRTTAIIIFIGK
jgi:hypothetical protein